MATTKKAVIVGAGIAGLAAALRLHQAGWAPLVVERAPGRRTGGYGVTFGGIGYEAAERMGILSPLRERVFPTEQLLYVKPNGDARFTLDGDTIRAMTSDTDLAILRGDIESVLYEEVEGKVEIRFSTTIEAVEQDSSGVRATLSDGTVEEADLLIGADGLHSATRALVFGPEEDYRLDLGHMAGVFMTDHTPEGIPANGTASLTNRGRTLAVIGLGDKGSATFFSYRTADPMRELADGPQKALPRAFADLGWIAPDSLERLRSAESVYFDTLSQMVVGSWSKGRVVLLGDAAWCVTLFAGYGSSLAVGGAERLGAALERHPEDITAALTEWEAGLRPEAERKQKLGRRIKNLYSPAGPVGLFVRDLPLRLAGWPPVTRYLKRRLQLKG